MVTSTKRRNSSIELLRIISMFMILVDHMVLLNATPLSEVPASIDRMALQVMQSLGNVGVVIFFTISVWFLLEEEQTLRDSMRRIWLLDRELLFWSLLTAAFFFIFDRAVLDGKMIVRLALPMLMSEWWYPTAYAIILTIIPFLLKGLRFLGKRNHLILCGILLFVYGVLGFVPGAPTIEDNVFRFVYLAVLISAYKWYFKSVSTGKLVLTLAACALLVIGEAFARYESADVLFLMDSWVRPVVICAALSIFLLFERHNLHCHVIDRFASSAFAVYLITTSEPAIVLLWHNVFRLDNLHAGGSLLLTTLAISLLIYFTCSMLDFCRQALFRITVDRNKGRWFDVVWMKLHACILKKVKLTD